MANQEKDNFRDSIGTIREDGKRAWVFPRNPVEGFINTGSWSVTFYWHS